MAVAFASTFGEGEGEGEGDTCEGDTCEGDDCEEGDGSTGGDGNGAGDFRTVGVPIVGVGTGSTGWSLPVGTAVGFCTLGEGIAAAFSGGGALRGDSKSASTSSHGLLVYIPLQEWY